MLAKLPLIRLPAGLSAKLLALYPKNTKPIKATAPQSQVFLRSIAVGYRSYPECGQTAQALSENKNQHTQYAHFFIPTYHIFPF